MYGQRGSQRPSRRGADGSVSLAERLRSAVRYLPLVGKTVLVLIFAGLIFTGYRAAASASFFNVRTVEIGGTSRASADQVHATVRRALATTGVWRADLSALSTQLEHLPWIRTAIVSRLLPDGVRVRVTERVPRAVIRNAAGRFYWVDDD